MRSLERSTRVCESFCSHECCSCSLLNLPGQTETTFFSWTLKLTPLGEKTPKVPPSSLMDTPISANMASLEERHASGERDAINFLSALSRRIWGTESLPLQSDGFSLPQFLLPGLVQLGDDLLCFLSQSHRTHRRSGHQLLRTF